LSHGLHQADVTFLNQVQKLQPAIGVFFGNGNDEAEVGLDQFFFGLFGFGFSPKYHLKHALQIGKARLAGNFDFAQLRCGGVRSSLRASAAWSPWKRPRGAPACRLAFEGLQPLDRVADFFNQAFFLKTGGTRSSAPVATSRCAGEKRGTSRAGTDASRLRHPFGFTASRKHSL